MTNASIDQKLATLMDVTIEDESAQLLYDMVAPPDGEKECIAVRLLLGNGHSGFGLYVASADYPEEGAMLLAPVAAHAVAQAQPVAWSGDPSVQDYASTQSPPLEKPRAVELPEPDMVTKTAPETIYLCVSDEPEDANLPFDEGGIYVDEGITWSRGKPIACCVEYVRADQVHHLLAAERQKYEDVLTLARKALKECRKELYEWMADHGQDTATQEARAKAISAIAAIDKLKEGA